MKILHICPDEKFIDAAINNFDKCNDRSEYVVITNSTDLKYVTLKHRVKKISLVRFIYLNSFNKFKNYDLIVFHSMITKNRVILKLLRRNSKQKIIWIGFGFDYYSLLNQNFILDYKVKSELNIIDYKKIKKKLIDNVLGDKLIFDKIDYFAPVFKSEYDFLKSKLKFKVPYIDWNYASFSGVLNYFDDRMVYGDSILVGNSASPSNNHKHIIEKLSELRVNNKLVFPLSYGDNGYRSYVKAMLVDSNLTYVTMEDFIERSSYFKSLLECQYVIMNHIRQQGSGNVLMMIYLGAKVFLNSQSLFFKELVDLGFDVYDISDISLESLVPLTNEKKIKNKELIISHYSNDVILNKTRNLIKKCGR
ncbi:4-alpha-L-fucosyltransferase [Vibrio sp. JCM 19052]|nr:4-alpha-L-fucosyltransferase [Vibrio sp. JCM 19052]